MTNPLKGICQCGATDYRSDGPVKIHHPLPMP